jgi:hypothetical protein
VVDGLEGWSQDSCEPPGRNQENNDISAAGPRAGGTRPRGLTVRISEQQERERPVQPEGANTPLEEVRPTMLDSLAASSVHLDYRRQLEMDTQDSVEDFFFRRSRRYPSRGAGGFSSAGRGAERPSGAFPGADRGAEQPPRPQPQRQSLPSRSARSNSGILPGRARTKTVGSARSSPGGGRRVRISAGRSPHQDGTDAGVRAPEAVEGATTATVMTISATGRPTEADLAADQAAVQAAEDGEARHRRRTRPQAAPEERHHPRLPLEEEAAPELEDHHSTGSADLPRG